MYMYNCSGTLLFVVVMFISVPMMRTRSRSDKEKQAITGHSGGAGGLPPSMLQASGGAVGGPSGMYVHVLALLCLLPFDVVSG